MDEEKYRAMAIKLAIKYAADSPQYVDIEEYADKFYKFIRYGMFRF